MTTSKYDGRDVRQHQIKVTNTGDGLSKAVAVDPIDLHLGDKVYALIECVKTRDGYEEINGGADLKLVHTLKGGSATLIDEAIARPLVEAQILRIVKARDEAAGQGSLLDGDTATNAEPKKARNAAKKAGGGGTVTPIGAKRAAKKTAAKKAPAKK